MSANARRLVSRPTPNGQYRLEPMGDAEHEAFERELTRPDFEHSHGVDPVNFERAYKMQQGLCASCMQPLDVTACYLDNDGGHALVCADDSAVIYARRDAARFNGVSPV